MQHGDTVPHSPVPILSHINSVRASPCRFFKIYFNIVLPCMSRFFKLSLSIRFPHQNPVCTFSVPMRATYPARLVFLDLICNSAVRTKNSRRAMRFIAIVRRAYVPRGNIVLSYVWSRNCMRFSFFFAGCRWFIGDNACEKNEGDIAALAIFT